MQSSTVILFAGIFTSTDRRVALAEDGGTKSCHDDGSGGNKKCHAMAESAAGWKAAGSAPSLPETEWTGCTLDRLDHLSHAEFLSEYEGRRPFILSRQGNTAGTLGTFGEGWSKKAFVSQFGDADVPVGRAESRTAIRPRQQTTLRAYIAGLTQEEPPTSSSGSKSSCPAGIAAEEQDYFFQFDARFWARHPQLDQQVSPPAFLGGGVNASVLTIGGAGTGIPFHTHGDSWLELIAGRKRWSLYSMAAAGTPQGGYSKTRSHASWLRDVYPGLRIEDRPLDCIQKPGEIVYVPVCQQLSPATARCWRSFDEIGHTLFGFCCSVQHGYFHAVENLGIAVAVGGQIGSGEPGQYLPAHAALIRLQQELGRSSTREQRDDVVRRLGELLTEEPRLDGLAMTYGRALRDSGGGSSKPDPDARAAAIGHMEDAVRLNPFCAECRVELAQLQLQVGATASQRSAFENLQMAWQADRHGWLAPWTLCQLMAKKASTKEGKGLERMSPAARTKLGTVCFRAAEMVTATAAGVESILGDDADGGRARFERERTLGRAEQAARFRELAKRAEPQITRKTWCDALMQYT